MVQTVIISLERPVGSARIIADNGTFAAEEIALSEESISSAKLSQRVQQYLQATAALSAISAKLSELYEKEVRQHNQQIAKLAVEISRKVLMQEISDGHYKIESILQEALKNAPSREGVVVYLNPADVAVCRQLQETNSVEAFAGITLSADANVRPADCVVETPRGIVESFTEAHLHNIAEALAHTQS